MRVRIALMSFAPAFFGIAVGPLAAQQWPVKPVRIIVPYQPGGVSDLAARFIAPKLSDSMGQQVIVENRPGGSGTIGVGAVVKSAPDGYTLVAATSGDFTISQHLVKDIAYDPLVDLAPVSSLTGTPSMIAVTATSAYKVIGDVLADARKQPGKLSYSHAGVGTVTHIFMEWVATATGTSFSHVPYKGGAPAAAAVAAGDVQVGALAVQSAMPHIKSGKIRMIANTAAERSPIIPDVPTLREGGVPEVDGTSYTAMFAPKGTPPAIIDKLNAEVAKALLVDDVKEKLLAGASMPVLMKPAELLARMQRESAVFKAIIVKGKITAE